MTDPRTPFHRVLAWGMALYLLVAIVGFGMRRSDYSHMANTISELGEFGGDDSLLVSWGVFFIVGAMSAALSAALIRSREHAAAMLAGCIAIGYLVAAFFPCDPGAPSMGSGRNTIHMWGGAVEYFGGAAALFWMAWCSRSGRAPFLAAAALVLFASIALSLPAFHDVRGLVQRCAETWLFGAVILWTMRRV